MYLRRTCWEPRSNCSSNDSSSDCSLSSSASSNDGYPSDIFVSETNKEIAIILHQHKLAQDRSFFITRSRNFIHLHISAVWEQYDVIPHKNDIFRKFLILMSLKNTINHQVDFNPLAIFTPV